MVVCPHYFPFTLPKINTEMITSFTDILLQLTFTDILDLRSVIFKCSTSLIEAYCDGDAEGKGKKERKKEHKELYHPHK